MASETTAKRTGRDTIAAFSAIAMDPTLSADEKVIWNLYRAYDWTGRGAFPGDDKLALHLQRDERTVRRHRKRLVERGYLEQKRRFQKPAVYRAVLPEWIQELIADAGDNWGQFVEFMTQRGEWQREGVFDLATADVVF